MSTEVLSPQAHRQISRREVLKWPLKIVAETALFNASTQIGLAAKSDTRSHVDKNLGIALADLETRQSGAPLRVDYYSFDILHASAQIENHQDVTAEKLALASLAVNFALGYLTKEASGNVNSAVGAASYALAAELDTYSTVEGAKPYEDPRFIEYGFNKYLFTGETNIRISNFPSEEELLLKQVTFSIPATVVAYFIPFVGRSFLGVMPLIAKNNVDVGRVIQRGLLIGDEVKDLIGNGFTNDGIRNYLNERIDEAKAHR